MTVFEIILIGISLSMDAFAVSIGKGLTMKKVNIKHTLIIALYFGGFQALMPLIGWVLGKQFSKYISTVDHWIAFGLLCFIGIKMIIDAIKDKDEAESPGLDHKELLLMAIATSIDALAVGITFGLMGMGIWLPISLIGAVTFAICFSGVFMGSAFGSRFKGKAQIVGGAVLILLGIKILLEHLGILIF